MGEVKAFHSFWRRNAVNIPGTRGYLYTKGQPFPQWSSREFKVLIIYICYRDWRCISLKRKMPPKMETIEGPSPCPRCTKKVYKAEEVICEGSKWHKSCFGCLECRKKLDSTTCNTHEGMPVENSSGIQRRSSDRTWLDKPYSRTLVTEKLLK